MAQQTFTYGVKLYRASGEVCTMVTKLVVPSKI